MQETNLQNLVINKVESQEVYDALNTNGAINDNELYLVGGGSSVDSVNGQTGDVNLDIPIVHKVESQDAYDEMVTAGQINDGELYLVQGDEYVQYTEQTLTEEQKAQARENIGVESPTPDWNQNDPEGKGYIKNRPFYDMGYISIATSISRNDATASQESDILEKFHAMAKQSEPVILTVGNKSFTLQPAGFTDGYYTLSYNGREAVYHSIRGTSSSIIFKISSEFGLTDGTPFTLTTGELHQIPSKFLPIDGTSIILDDSGNLSAPPPQENFSLGLTGVSVGQMAKIKAVDSNGAPTEWETIDGYTGQVTADKLKNPDHDTDLVQYAAFQAAVPMVRSMDITRASAGQVLVIKTVDDNGSPLTWEAKDISDLVSNGDEVSY